MRFLVHIEFPVEPFNTHVRDGSSGDRIRRVVEATQPESIWFSETDGRRGAVAVHELESVSEIPRIAEPWFLTFAAECRFRVAMTLDDLAQARLDELGKKWR